MIYYRCKCGKSTAYGSYGPSRCLVCPECGSTLASHPDYHAEPIEHDWQPRFDERTGRPKARVCDRCGDVESIRPDVIAR